jgi:radical SAM superfamily enzyme YgiQ (UPF0313 family)
VKIFLLFGVPRRGHTEYNGFPDNIRFTGRFSGRFPGKPLDGLYCREFRMRLYLINPVNPLALCKARAGRWNRYRIWKPLGLLTVAALTPREWEITVLDENLEQRDYAAMPRPDLVGITAFTSQASRAYDLAEQFRARGVKVVMGGIHASMRPDEALEHADAIVVGEAESMWGQVLADAQGGRLQRLYKAEMSDVNSIPPARHDLLPDGYAFGAIQTTRGCPLNCSFCSVTAFNGSRYRHRPIAEVIEELRLIRERMILVVDDNLIGISPVHINRAKDLFRAMIAAKLRKTWIAQVTINMADDPELLRLAARAGCTGVFIGFESPTAEGLAEVGKKFNIVKGRDPRRSVRTIQRHGIMVVGSFIIGLDADGHGIGQRVADAGSKYGVDLLNALFLTPLPGTRLWDKMESEDRIGTNTFPEDWRYYTLSLPVARYKLLSRNQIIREMESCDRIFYSPWRMVRRLAGSFWRRRHPFISLVGNLSFRRSISANHRAYREFSMART